jgi:uncharacterized protein (TIGR00369 family)
MKYKLLVLNMDGALMNGHREITYREITPAALAALMKVQQMGVRIVLASGASAHGLFPIAGQLELDKYNGYILSYDGRQIFNMQTMEQEVIPYSAGNTDMLDVLMEKLSVLPEEVMAVGDEAVQAVEEQIIAKIQPADVPLDQLNIRSKHTLMGNLGIRYTCATEDRVEATMPVDTRTRQPFGILHGGATLALAETVAGLGSMILCRPDQMSVGMQVSGNHISSAREGDTVRAVGTIIHKGRTSHVWNVDVFTSAGKLVSSVRVVNSILSKR